MTGEVLEPCHDLWPLGDESPKYPTVSLAVTKVDGNADNDRDTDANDLAI